MKSNSFDIKVSDLLKQPGNQDNIKFENLYIEDIYQLNEKGISGEIELIAVNNYTILATLKNIKCIISNNCDKCTDLYKRNINIDEYTCKFVLMDSEMTQEEEESTEEIFPIDSKSENINIQEMLYQSIMLQEPITKKCPKCQVAEENDDLDEGLEEFESNSNIVFH